MNATSTTTVTAGCTHHRSGRSVRAPMAARARALLRTAPQAPPWGRRGTTTVNPSASTVCSGRLRRRAR